MGNARRRKKLLPVSFFAFQDIVTALAGSLLIIVLLMVINKYNHVSGDRPETAASGTEYRALQNRITYLEKQLKSRRKEIAGLRERFDYQQQTLRQQEQELLFRQQTLNLHNEMTRRRQLQLQMLNDVSRLESQLQRVSPEIKKMLTTVQTIEDAQKQLANAQLQFKLMDSNHKNTVLLDCARSRWRWSDSQQHNIELGQDGASPQQALDDLRRRLSSLPHTENRLVIAVRPSAGGFAQALKDQLRKDFPGLEIVALPMRSDNIGGIRL